MASIIPDFDHNLVLPPQVGNPATSPMNVSPYPCSSEDVCIRFATTLERIKILRGWLDFREELRRNGLVQGYQWLDGSFLEDVETREKRPPNDLDLLTIYWGYDAAFQGQLVAAVPEFRDKLLSKDKYKLDHFPLDVGYSPELTVELVRYWLQLFTHNRDGVWKGMLKVDLDTPDADNNAKAFLLTHLV